MGNVNQYNECESKKYERETEKNPTILTEIELIHL